MPRPHVRHVPFTPPLLLVLPVLLVMLVMALVAGPAQAAGDRDNAAWWYQRAIEAANRVELTGAEQDLLYGYEGGVPSPALRSILDRIQPALNDLRRGAEEDYADWGLDYSQGLGLLLPHLSPMRQLTRWMRADVHARIADGDVDGLTRNVTSLYRMSGHTTSDQVLISSLVGQAIFALTDQTFQIAIDHEAIDLASAAEVLRALRTLDERDPFAYVDAMVMEREVFVDSMENMFEDRSDAEVLADLQSLIGSGEDARVEDAARAFLETGIDAQFDGFDRMLNSTVEAYQLEDEDEARAMLDRIDEELSAGEYGQLARILAPSYARLYDRLVESRQLVGDRIAMLEEIVAGELDLAEAVNAAGLYRRAWKEMEELTPAERAIIVAAGEGRARPTDEGRSRGDADERAEPGAGPESGLDAGPDAAVTSGPNALDGALRSATGILALCGQAASLDRCRWDGIHGRSSPSLAPEHVAMMRRLTDLVHAAAARSIERGDHAAAADRIAVALGMMVHLGQAKDLLAGPMAAVLLERTAALVGELLAACGPAEAASIKATIRGPLSRITIGDPFGSIEGIAGARRAAGRFIDRVVDRHGLGSTLDDEQRAAVPAGAAIARGLTGPQLMYVVAMMNLDWPDELRMRGMKADGSRMMDEAELAEARSRPVRLAGTEHLPHMEGLLDLEAIERASSEIPATWARMAAGEPDEALRRSDLPVIARLDRRIGRARSLVRGLLVDVSPATPGPAGAEGQDATAAGSGGDDAATGAAGSSPPAAAGSGGH